MWRPLRRPSPPCSTLPTRASGRCGALRGGGGRQGRGRAGKFCAPIGPCLHPRADLLELTPQPFLNPSFLNLAFIPSIAPTKPPPLLHSLCTPRTWWSSSSTPPRPPSSGSPGTCPPPSPTCSATRRVRHCVWGGWRGVGVLNPPCQGRVACGRTARCTLWLARVPACLPQAYWGLRGRHMCSAAHACTSQPPNPNLPAGVLGRARARVDGHVWAPGVCGTRLYTGWHGMCA